MSRPKIIRRIFFQPNVTYFKPAGIPMKHLKETTLSFDELEAIRLVDFEQKDQIDVAKKMDISQPTLSRLLTSVREKTADALVNGKAIKIYGGNFEFIKKNFSKSKN